MSESIKLPTSERLSLADVSETGLLTLSCRAAESQSENPILNDPQAEMITAALKPLLLQSDRKMLRMLGQGRLKPKLVVHIALRAQKFDQYTQDFLSRHPDGVVVNLGCGMDTRFSRIDNGQVHFFDLDLPPVIGVRKHFFEESERYQMIASSVLDHAWMDQVLRQGPRPALFLAEGLFMYLPPEQVKELVVTLQKRFPDSELVCEVTHRRWISGLGGAIAWRKMQRELAFGGEARFQFGIADSRELERWSPGIAFLDEWSYFDTNHPKLGWERGPGKWEFFRKIQWTAHYRLSAEKTNSFESVTLNRRGEVTARTPGEARFFVQPLPGGAELEMVAVPGGSFQMGSQHEGGYEDERPVHPVFLTGFWLGRHPVTQRQWQAVMGSRPGCRFQGPDLPVENINWKEASEFCQRLSQITGRDYHLPSEAQWEYACRAGASTPFHLGDTITTDYANYVGEHTFRDEPPGIYRHVTTPAGTFAPNAWGLYDMHGNVWEFCADIWSEDYSGAPVDGSAQLGGRNAAEFRVARGGSWHETPGHCRCAARLRVAETDRLEYYGLRVALRLEKTQRYP